MGAAFVVFVFAHTQVSLSRIDVNPMAGHDFGSATGFD